MGCRSGRRSLSVMEPRLHAQQLSIYLMGCATRAMIACPGRCAPLVVATRGATTALRGDTTTTLMPRQTVLTVHQNKPLHLNLQNASNLMTSGTNCSSDYAGFSVCWRQSAQRGLRCERWIVGLRGKRCLVDPIHKSTQWTERINRDPLASMYQA